MSQPNQESTRATPTTEAKHTPGGDGPATVRKCRNGWSAYTPSGTPHGAKKLKREAEADAWMLNSAWRSLGGADMQLALDAIAAGVARLEKREFCFAGMRYSVSDGDWSGAFTTFGLRDRVRSAIAKATGGAA